MPLPPTALLNGYRVSHASYKFRILGLLIPVREFNWKVSVDRGKARANAREPIASTIGEVSYEASCTVLQGEWDALKDRIRTVYGHAPLDAQGDAVLTCSERAFPSRTVQVHFNGLNEADATTSQGPDAKEVKLTFDVAFIKEDGQPMVDGSIY